MGKVRNVWWTGRVLPIRRGGHVVAKGRSTFIVLHPRRKIVVDFHPFRGFFVSATHPRSTVGLSRATASVVWEFPSMKKKLQKSDDGDGKHLAPVETNHLAQLLPLVEHCCCRRYDDGDPREPGWFTVKTSGSAWIVQVKDPDSGMSFSAIGETLDKALETAALLLGCDEAPWEPDQWLKQKKTRSSKK